MWMTLKIQKQVGVKSIKNMRSNENAALSYSLKEAMDNFGLRK